MTLRLARPLAVAALLAAPLLPVAAHAGTFSALDAFGDSLSDAGNDYLALTIAHQPPEPVSPPYSNGRFSNGAVWAQDLAVAEGLASVTPRTRRCWWCCSPQGAVPRSGHWLLKSCARCSPAATASPCLPGCLS